MVVYSSVGQPFHYTLMFTSSVGQGAVSYTGVVPPGVRGKLSGGRSTTVPRVPRGSRPYWTTHQLPQYPYCPPTTILLIGPIFCWKILEEEDLGVYYEGPNSSIGSFLGLCTLIYPEALRSSLEKLLQASIKKYSEMGKELYVEVLPRYPRWGLDKVQ